MVTISIKVANTQWGMMCEESVLNLFFFGCTFLTLPLSVQSQNLRSHIVLHYPVLCECIRAWVEFEPTDVLVYTEFSAIGLRVKEHQVISAYIHIDRTRTWARARAVQGSTRITPTELLICNCGSYALNMSQKPNTVF